MISKTDTKWNDVASMHVHEEEIVEKREKEERIIDHRKKIYKFQSMV
jgi:hypothetical protein